LEGHETALHVDGLPEVMLILVLELLFQYPPLATAPPQRCLPSKEHLVLVPCLVKRDTGFPVKDERGEPVGLVSDEASWVCEREHGDKEEEKGGCLEGIRSKTKDYLWRHGFPGKGEEDRAVWIFLRSELSLEVAQSLWGLCCYEAPTCPWLST
jgi:hypothetical protein